MNYQEFVASRVKWLDTPQLNLVHSAMGLLGECVEYCEAFLPSHQREELGDLEFYYEHAIQTVAKIGDVIPRAVTLTEISGIERDPEYWLMHWCAKYHDYAKKAFIYNKPLGEVDFLSPLARIAVCLSVLAKKLRYTRAEIQRENQEKLEARYPLGYTDEAAQKRADKLNTGAAFV